MSFIVCPAATTVFRVELSDIRVLLNNHTQRPDREKAWFTGNFDNYRTIVSPKKIVYSNGEVLFEDYKSLFIYETQVEPPELLVAKLFSINVFGNTDMDFIGGASIDLLTLASGPRRVVLRLFDGDSIVGRIAFEITMSDQTDTLVWLRELQVESVGTVHPLLTKLLIHWEPNLDASQSTKFIDMSIDPSNHSRGITFPEQPHSIPMTLNSLFGGEGLTFRVHRSNFCGKDDLGIATLLFQDALKEVEPANQLQVLERVHPQVIWDQRTKSAGGSNQQQQVALPPREEAPRQPLQTGSQNVSTNELQASNREPPAPGTADVDAAERSATPSTGAKHDVHVNEGVVQELVPTLTIGSEQRRFERCVDFRLETSGGQDNVGEQFILSGKVWLSKIPRFAQMIGGITVEGVVCGGERIPGNHPKAPFNEVEDSSV